MATEGFEVKTLDVPCPKCGNFCLLKTKALGVYCQMCGTVELPRKSGKKVESK